VCVQATRGRQKLNHVSGLSVPRCNAGPAVQHGGIKLQFAVGITLSLTNLATAALVQSAKFDPFDSALGNKKRPDTVGPFYCYVC
jgi:hypothetical protein